MRRKTVVSFLVMVMMTGSLVAGAAPVNLKFNHVQTTTNFTYDIYQQFAEDLKEASNGEVTMEVYAASALGETPDIMEQAAMGENVIADCDLAYLGNYVKDFAALMSPYLIQNPEEVLILWNSDLFADLCAQLEQKGLHLIAMNYDGTRNLLTKTPINSRSDVSGLKIRCAPAAMWNRVVEVLGGNPTNIAQSELYQALSQGVADGAECPFFVFYTKKWHEVCKYITLTEHLHAYCTLVMSSDVYNSLSDEAKKAVNEVSLKYMNEFLEAADEQQLMYKRLLEEEGVIISEIDKTEFIEASKAIPEFFPEWTPGFYDSVVALLETGR